MNRFPCRCKRCGARKTLAEMPGETVSRCRCEACQEARAKGITPNVHCPCGGAYRVDTYRKTKEHKRMGCRCSGFPWDNGTHRKGSASPANGWYCYDWKGDGNAYP